MSRQHPREMTWDISADCDILKDIVSFHQLEGDYWGIEVLDEDGDWVVKNDGEVRLHLVREVAE